MLAILGTVATRAQGKSVEGLSIRTRIFALFGLIGMGSLGAEYDKAVVWIGFFAGLGFLLAMEVKGGALRDHGMFDHPPTGEQPLGFGRKVVAVITLAMFAALFMPTPFAM